MYQQNRKQTKQKDLSESAIAKIKEACASSKINSNPLEIVISALERIVKHYYSPLQAEQFVQYAEYISKNFGYLTTDELELAFDMAVKGDIEIDYISRGLTFTHLQKVLNSYKNKAYSIKFGEKKPNEDNTTMEGWWETVCKQYNFYKFLPANNTNLYLRLVDWLIETKQIGEPEGWNAAQWEVKFKTAPGYIKIWLKACYPDIVVYERKEEKKGSSLQGIGTLARKVLGV